MFAVGMLVLLQVHRRVALARGFVVFLMILLLVATAVVVFHPSSQFGSVEFTQMWLRCELLVWLLLPWFSAAMFVLIHPLFGAAWAWRLRLTDSYGPPYAGAGGASRRVPEAVHHDADPGRVEGGRGLASGSSNSARSHPGCQATVRQGEAAGAAPGDVAPGLATGVRELRPGYGAEALHEPGDRGPRLRLAVVPDAVSQANPPFPPDGGGLGDHQERSADRTAREMPLVPLVRHPLVGRVLAHRGDDDPVPQRDRALRERVKR